MVSKLVKRVNDKIENEKLLYITMDCDGSTINNAVVPDMISVEDEEIYVEGGNLMLHITNEKKFQVDYDDSEEEFVIKQGDTTYYIS